MPPRRPQRRQRWFLQRLDQAVGWLVQKLVGVFGLIVLLIFYLFLLAVAIAVVGERHFF